MFYLKNPITTINTIYQHLQYWLKLSPFWLSLVTIGTITLYLSNQLTIPTYAETQSDNRINEILREITFCQKDGDTGKFIFGYNHFLDAIEHVFKKNEKITGVIGLMLSVLGHAGIIPDKIPKPVKYFELKVTRLV